MSLVLAEDAMRLDRPPSLDDAMRTVYRDTKRKGYAGLTERRFRAACEAAAGAPLPEIFDGMLDTTDEIDFDEYLRLAGHTLKPDRPKRGRPAMPS